jgi:hypothetical protein
VSPHNPSLFFIFAGLKKGGGRGFWALNRLCVELEAGYLAAGHEKSALLAFARNSRARLGFIKGEAAATKAAIFAFCYLIGMLAMYIAIHFYRHK